MNEKIKTKNKIIIAILVLSIVTFVGAVSYAYFTAMAETKPQEVSGTTGVMRLKFSDNDEGINAELKFGESITKKFTLENTGTVDATVNIFWKDMINTYLENSLTYSLSYGTTETTVNTNVIDDQAVPTSSIISNKVLANGITIPAGQTYYFELNIKLNYLADVDQTSDLDAKFNTKFEVVNENELPRVNVPALMMSSAKSETLKPWAANIDFVGISDIYSMEDDYGMSYFYRGDVQNNYVKFGRWAEDTPTIVTLQGTSNNSMGNNITKYNTLEECEAVKTDDQTCTILSRAGKDMYWRIVRLNGDGTLRLVYDGTEPYTNYEQNSDRFALFDIPWNNNAKDDNDTKYVGYMYGGSLGEPSTSVEEATRNETSSYIKTQIDEWYLHNLEQQVDNKGNKYSSYISDTLFCNDRSIQDGPGYGNELTRYEAGNRILRYTAGKETNTTLICSNKNDRFTVSDTINGNGALTYPIGLLTLDESINAGRSARQSADETRDRNKSYYLNKVYASWSISPRHNSIDDSNNITCLQYYGQIFSITGGASVAPVINIAPEYAQNMIGEGTRENPYRVS